MIEIKSPEDFRKLFESAEDEKAKYSSAALLKIRRCKVEIHNYASFFSRLLLSLELVEDWSIKTMCTNGTHIRYNPKFTMTLTDPECIFVLMHEMLHIIFLHFDRIRGRNHKQWNYATDFAINLLLQDKDFTRCRLKMPVGGLLDPKYKGMSAEQIYDLRPQNPNKGKTLRDLLKDLMKNHKDQNQKDQSKKDNQKQKQDKNKEQNKKPSAGDVIQTSDGKFAKISNINSDGSYECDEITKQQYDDINKKEVILKK